MNSWSIKKIRQILILVISIIAFNCDLNSNNSNFIVSTFGDTESHNVGEDCMECHNNGGSAGLEFSIAGSVYKSIQNLPYANVRVSLYSENDMSDIPSELFEVDGYGNFYSNIPIDWQNGLFTSVSSSNQTKYMNGIVFSGSCNRCHGVDIPKINIE